MSQFEVFWCLVFVLIAAGFLVTFVCLPVLDTSNRTSSHLLCWMVYRRIRPWPFLSCNPGRYSPSWSFASSTVALHWYRSRDFRLQFLIPPPRFWNVSFLPGSCYCLLQKCAGHLIVPALVTFTISGSLYMYVESSWNLMAHGDAREGKWRGNWRMEWADSTLTLPRNTVYPAFLPLMRTPRLLVVDWTDAPVDLNGLVRFAERRNLVSARVPSHFKRGLPLPITMVCIIAAGPRIARFMGVLRWKADASGWHFEGSVIHENCAMPALCSEYRVRYGKGQWVGSEG
jgi:hypothetical protein